MNYITYSYDSVTFVSLGKGTFEKLIKIHLQLNITSQVKKKILFTLTFVVLLLFPSIHFCQTINLGTTESFVLFTSDGAVTNSGVSHLTGNVGTNNGSSTGFGNVNGVMHDGDVVSAQAFSDLLVAYNQLNSVVANQFPAPQLGNGQTLFPGIYSISAAASIDLQLNLDAQGDPNAEFIFQIDGPLSTSANSRVNLMNEALACNVFWKVEGLVSMAAGSSMKGTIVANNAGINMNTNDTLEGRALSTSGAITIDGVLAYTPTGCGSPILAGPAAPNLGTAECYAIFSSNGAISNTGITNVMGDVGTNVGSTTGFDPLLVTGNIHPIPDVSTAQCASDLLTAYNYLNTLSNEIELLYPAQFGNSLVLTPHTYVMNAAATFTDTLFLNAQGNVNAVFVIKINGAMSTSTYSTVQLMNGAQAKNIYWKIEGAVDINNYSVFCGTIVCNNGALGVMNTGVVLNGRALTTDGALNTTAMSTTMTTSCTTPVSVPSLIKEEQIAVYPNPFMNLLNIKVNSSNIKQYELRLFNVLGEEVMNTLITKPNTTIQTTELPTGVYMYKLIYDNEVIQSGKLISQQ